MGQAGCCDQRETMGQRELLQWRHLLRNLRCCKTHVVPIAEKGRPPPELPRQAPCRPTQLEAGKANLN